MIWSNRFIGIPHEELGRSRDGADCWGLACIIYREELGITLPEYLDYSSTAEHGELSAVIEGATASPLWIPVEGPAIAFDIALFRRGKLATHAGIVIRHGLMIHSVHGASSVVTPIRGPWASRHVGHYRHVELISGRSH